MFITAAQLDTIHKAITEQGATLANISVHPYSGIATCDGGGCKLLVDPNGTVAYRRGF